MIMGVVADDITGSNDIGIMFAKAGCLAHIYAYPAPGAYALARSRPNAGAYPAPDICILDTNSRLDLASLAYAKVYAATRELQAAGCRHFFNKTCSVFRGNIGVEFDAMLDALGMDFAVVVLGFPKNGRITRAGIHYVHGKRLEESEFRNDPIHPMHSSNLVEILQSQTQRKVGLISHTWVSQGVQVLQARLDQMRPDYQYVILDVLDQPSLATIAQAVQDVPVLCGSSALAEELPQAWEFSGRQRSRSSLHRHPDLGIPVISGSLMPQSAAQVRYLHAQGTPVLELDPLRLFEPAARAAEVARLVMESLAAMRSGFDIILHSPYNPDGVERTRQAGQQAGLSVNQIARQVSETLAEAAAQVLETSGQNRLVVAGGETSAAVCARLGVDGLEVWQEIQPGLPSCLSLTGPAMLLVLKSGSFGSPEFLQQAIAHLREQ